jgi:hypothetical protein
MAHHALNKHCALLPVTCRLTGRIGHKRNEAVYLFVGHGKSLARNIAKHDKKPYPESPPKEIPRRTYNAGGFPFTTSD